jgi:SAM-dependent methyltransferase
MSDFFSKKPGIEDTSEAETLRRLGKMDQFNTWLYSKIEPWMGNRILEVGCGLGNFTRFFSGRERVVGIDFSRKHLEEFRQRNPDLNPIELHTFDAGDPSLTQLGEGSFDTIVCLNVLEHVENDRQALNSFHRLLQPGGHLLLLVPAFPCLFGTLDLNGPHFRRYTRRGLEGLLAEENFYLLKMQYFNLFGIPGWWFCGKILRRPILPAGGLGWYERLMPLFRRIEAWTGPPVGLSLIAIAQKPGESSGDLPEAR